MESKYNVRRKSPISMVFTLIECLVVVTIIVLLMSILLPSLSRAKREVDKIACFNNQKQINYAENMYLQDFNGYFQMTLNYTYWDKQLIDYKYINCDRIFKCLERQKLRLGTDTNPSDYVTNYCVFKPLLVVGVYSFLNISQVRYPSETLELLDMQTEPLGRGLASFGVTGVASRIGYLHVGGINTVFVDGHTQWFRFGNLTNAYYTLEKD